MAASQFTSNSSSSNGSSSGERRRRMLFGVLCRLLVRGRGGNNAHRNNATDDDDNNNNDRRSAAISAFLNQGRGRAGTTQISPIVEASQPLRILSSSEAESLHATCRVCFEGTTSAATNNNTNPLLSPSTGLMDLKLI